MKEIVVPGGELFNSETEEFSYGEEYKLRIEHSLISIAKWESKWHIPFFSDKKKTTEQTLDYIKFMTLNQNVPEDVYTRLTDENVKEIHEYMLDPQTATTVNHAVKDKKKKNTPLTNEVIYYQMTALNIPPEYQKWHINHLLKLIEVCNVYNAPPKKLSKKEALDRVEAINERNKARFKTKG